MTFVSRARPALTAIGKFLEALDQSLDRVFDKLFEGYDRFLSDILSTITKSIAIGFFLGLIALFFAFGLWGLFVTVNGCGSSMDYVTGLFPMVPDLPRPFGLPHR